jgi:phosphatidylglycerol:prolipoprotein diacylglycerol transferase
MMISFPFLSPGWLGVAVVSAVLLANLLPQAWRRRWIIMVGGVVIALLATLLDLVPLVSEMHLTGWSVAMLAGFVAAYLVSMPRARVLGIPERTIIDIFLLGLIGGVVGARFGEVIEQWPGFGRGADGQTLALGDLLRKAADFDGGGMVWYGGAITGGVLIALLAWQRRLGILQIADLFMPAIVLGLGLGRVGCFLNGCCYGRPTTLPWAVSAAGGKWVHPTQLYETIACLVLFALTWWWWRRRRWQGEVAFIGFLGYAAWRFINESLRGDTVSSSFLGWGVTTSQAVSLWLALGTLLLAAGVIWRRWRDPGVANRARHVPGSSNHQPDKEQRDRNASAMHD